MVQGYYTLEEAARILGMTMDNLSQMAQKREIRAFADRGTWRFRTQDIEEMARRLGRGSSPDLQLGDAAKTPQAKPGTPKPATPKPAGGGGDPGVFDFALGGDQVELGQEIVLESPSGRSGSRSGRSPSPQPGSDSDVKLVPDDSDVDFRVRVEDSDVKVQRTPGRVTPARKPGDSSKPASSKPGSAKPGSSKKSGISPVVDSGVRLVPMDDGGASPPKSPSDSDVRIDMPMTTGPGEEALLTDEIDLDAELRKAEEAARARKGHTPGKKTAARKPTNDATEFEMEVPKAKKQPTPKPAPRHEDDDAVVLGDLGPVDLAESSGINLHSPDDSGINLEKGGAPAEKVEFELQDSAKLKSTPKPAKPGPVTDSSSEFELAPGVQPTPKPAPAAPEDDSSSEFELSLDVEATPKPAPAVPEDDSSSEFELSLDVEATPKPVAAHPGSDSSSEFELTLDDSGHLAPIDEERAKDEVMETEFEVPSLEEDSAVSAEDDDTALESSDFDLSLNEEDSSSQVVALDDEEADDEAATVARAAVAEGDDEAAEVDELLDDDLVTAPAEEDEEALAASAAPAPWGVMPALVLLPCVVLMFVVTLMSFELVHNLWGYHQPNRPSGMITEGVAKMLSLEQANKNK